MTELKTPGQRGNDKRPAPRANGGAVTMDKALLLELEENAHLSVAELRQRQSKLTEALEERLERRARRKAATRLGGASEKLRALVEKIRLPIGEAPAQRRLEDATLAELRRAVEVDKELARDTELLAELDRLEKVTADRRPLGGKVESTLASSLRLDEPIAFHPELQRELDAARLFRLSDATGLGDTTAELLIAEVGKPTNITERRLDALVQDKKLTAEQAKAAGFAASLYNILDERPELVATARKGIEDPRQLVEHDQAAWTKLIRESKVKPPGGISDEEYAGLLEKKVKRLFPTDALASALRRVETGCVLEWSPGDTRRLTNRFSGMKLQEVLDDSALSEEARAREVERRTGLVRSFLADNVDVLGADLAPGSKESKELKLSGGASAEDKGMVLATARTYQRALTVTGDITDAEALVAGGYLSALSVAMSQPNEIAARTGLKHELAVRYHEKAKNVATAVTAHAGTLIDVLGGMFVNTGVGNLSTDIAGYLKEVPGFADFFGSQNFCDCRHCQSILGPAAYFVDLMCFVDEKVTQEHFAAAPDHPLALKSRRPDLWTLELTCENTNTPIPYLVVINEILENAVARDAGFAGDYGNRVAVEEKVYKDTLADQVDSFQQPLNLPFEELRTYLRHFGKSLADMAEVGGADGDALARLRLSLPPRDFELITAQSNTGLPFLRRIYGVSFSESGGVIEKLDVQRLLEPMGVTRHELGDIVATRFVTANGAVDIRIKGEKRSSDSVQNDVENISGLTRAALDRMHRFVRLWRATGWRVGELDLVLTHLERAGLGTALDEAAVRAVASVHRLQTTRDIRVEELIALWSTLPRHPVLRALPGSCGEDEEGSSVYPPPPSSLARLMVPLFDRVFNQKSFVEADGAYPQVGTAFLHPALASEPPASSDPNVHRLIAGAGVTEDELLQLILGLAGPLGIDPASSVDSDKAFSLDEGNLSLLYRHARLAKLLRVTVPELFALATLAPEIAGAHISTLSELEALFEVHSFTESSHWTLAELVRIIRPLEVALALPQPAEPTAADLAAGLVDEVERAEALLFSDTVFALLPGVTATQSVEIIAANASLIEPADGEGRHRLRAGFDPSAPLTMPPSVDVTLEPAVRELLETYHGGALLLSLLPSRVGVSSERLQPLIAMMGADLNHDDYFRELRGDTPPTAIADLIASLRPLGLLFEDEAVFDPENLDFVAGQAAMFGITDFTSLDLPAVRHVEAFRALLEPWTMRDDPAPSLRDVLDAFSTSMGFTGADQEQLAALLGCDVALLQSLAANLTLASEPLSALRQIADAVTFAQHVGAGGSALKLAQATAYADLASASAAVQAAFRAKYPEEEEWETKVEPYRDALLSRRRDGLVAFLVHSGTRQFDEVSDLYHYFLLDVELEGCARTSRVAAAIDSVQLYVHRCLMNLEESPPGATNAVHVLPESIPAEEWDWRKHYRVWEANRKIFLYPENFLEPELRDNKTPLFKQLEEELLSKEITDEAILEAYARYLRGFDELAHLTIAGSYHEKDESAERDVLHLFGVTADEPPTYYYRRVEDAHYGANSDERATHWGAWEKMDAQVPVRQVSPVVHKGQLYVFWHRYTTKPRNEVEGGTNEFVGYEHRAYVEFTKRRLDGSWTTPQSIRLGDSPFAEAFFPSWYREDGAIGDPIVTKSDALIAFDVRAEIMGMSIAFRANASGHATVVLLGQKLEFQLPASAMNAHATTKVEAGGAELTVTPIRNATLRAPLYDSQPHDEPKDGYTLRGFGWDRVYPATGATLSLRGFNFQMWSPVDLYRLEIGARYDYGDPYDTGVPWIHPGAILILILLLALFDEDFDAGQFLMDRLIWSRGAGERRLIHATSAVIPCFDAYSFADVLLDEANVHRYTGSMAMSSAEWNRPQWSEEVTDYLTSLLDDRPIADAPGDARLHVVNGSYGDVLVQTSRDAFYLQSSVRGDGKYELRRLNTSLSEDIADILFNQGLDTLLATETQLELGEHDTGMTLVDDEVHDRTGVGGVDYSGAMGTYLREIFFHIPFLIANHLNSQGRFEDAQRWYHYIFDPTAAESIQDLPAGLSEEERRRRALDRNWRYREFRGLTLDTLRAQLTDERAIDEYRRDPFNPHAVARLRLSAYQKAIVMKYVDNLLDWGDDLFVAAFAQRNAEYLREATLKYVTAQEILGERPPCIGDCGEGGLEPKVFPKLKEALGEGSELLMEMESVIAIRYRTSSVSRLEKKLLAVETDRAALEVTRGYSKGERVTSGAVAALRSAPPGDAGVLARAAAVQPSALQAAATKPSLADLTIAARKPRPSTPSTTKGRGRTKGKGITRPTVYETSRNPKVRWAPGWGVSLVRQLNPVFCVPGNQRMLGYWDRVEDRLYKLRHCMDINGVVRQLPLFAPPIDPALLVGGKAAGLSLDDVLAAGAGALPPYRFRYLIDKAKGFAAAVQGFGAALLGALEKRDAEELTRLRNTHQKNILALTAEVKRNELKIAEESLEVTRRRQEAAQYRHGYYDDLISSGLTLAEITQTTARITAIAANATQLGLATAAGISYLLPQVGSPFAMKYGGDEVGDSLKAFSAVAGTVGKVSEMVATVSGIFAGFERREQGWQHQKDLAAKDLKTIEKELVIAELRKSIATRGLELHEKSRDQHDEVIDFFEDKFSNLGLYTHLSRTLQQLHREAYNNALAMARLAEQAYRFERPSDTTVFVGGEWDASRSGLLAGERLSLALQNMEKRFIETNARRAEINQSFSLSQIDPRALIDLKEIGTCEFALPEFFFDMFYPGHYRRRIRAVRLTIPCITGPYTNVSAKMTLLRSYIRRDAALGPGSLLEVPPTGTTTVATSTGQGDAGVFELSFRDERYMPFEGAGAVSEWRIELPSQFRPFDYHSINDVILNVSYTAEDDAVLRQGVESQNASLVGGLLHYLSNNSLTRVFSLRQEFSSAFNRLTQAAAGTQVTIDITDRHFPLFLQGRTPIATSVDVVLAVEDRSTSVGAFSLSVNGTPASGFTAPTDPAAPGDPLGGLPTASLPTAFTGGLKQRHGITVDDAGALAPTGGSGGALDPDKVRDILFVVQYRL